MTRIVEDETPDKVEHCFGFVEIEGKTCGVDGCDCEPNAVYPVRIGEKSGAWWFCQEHADAFLEATPANGRNDLAEISRTCRAGDGETPCGAFATRVAILGVRSDSGAARLGALSVCVRHAAQLETLLEAQ